MVIRYGTCDDIPALMELAEKSSTAAHWTGGFDEAGLQKFAEELRSRLEAPQVSLGLVFMAPQFFPQARQVLEILRAEPSAVIEYVEFRDKDTLEMVEHASDDTLLALAIRIGKTRLIDNMLAGRGFPCREKC